MKRPSFDDVSDSLPVVATQGQRKAVDFAAAAGRVASKRKPNWSDKECPIPAEKRCHYNSALLLDASKSFTCAGEAAPMLQPQQNGGERQFDQPTVSSQLSRRLFGYLSLADDWNQIENAFRRVKSSMHQLDLQLADFKRRFELNQAYNFFPTGGGLTTNSVLVSPAGGGRKADERERRLDRNGGADVEMAIHEDVERLIKLAEQRALAAVADDRLQMDRLLRELQRQEDNVENCWNCGRRAGQACGGCGKARYCGSFCQHKDWPRHKPSCSAAAGGSKKFSDKSSPIVVKVETNTASERTPPLEQSATICGGGELEKTSADTTRHRSV